MPIRVPKTDPLGRDPHGPTGTAGPGQRVTVEGCGRVGRRTGYVEQNGAAAAAVDGAHVHAYQDQDGVAGGHAESQGGHQGDAQGGRQPRQHADADAEQGGPGDAEQCLRGGEAQQRSGEQGQAVEHRQVRGVIKATPRVAVSPGSMPTQTPSRMAQATLNNASGVAKLSSAVANRVRPSNIGRSGW